MTGISAADILRAENLLHKMKQRLIAMDAVPGSGDGTYDE
jgi:hypothetical protein